MVRSREEALKRANASRTNVPGTCQLWTRTQYDAPSAGDQDHDKDADAKDGWLSEPASARRSGRKPPKGVPVYFEKDGGKGYGHRCLTKDDNGLCRSTDMSGGLYKAGVVGDATIEQIERAMGVKYVGWSTTISGIPIPYDKPKTSRGVHVDAALKHLKKAKPRKNDSPRAKAILAATKALEKLPFIK